jgi:acyl-CoA thioester hydrolase
LTFRYLLRARYPECDAQGIVFNARYGDWADLATTELLRAMNPGFLEPGGVDYRLRRQETEWLAPARFDDVIEARPVVTGVGNTSFTVRTTFARGEDTLAVILTTYVLVDARTGTKRPIEDTLRAVLLHGAPGRVTDHAGVGGGRVARVVREPDRVTMPWKNGGGVTHELVRLGDGAAGFAVRLSIAEVAADGPFSRFPRVDRVITLLDGAGMRLTRSDGLVVTLDTPHRPFAFLGEDAWDCALVAGASRDFNVMVDRGLQANATPTAPGLVDARWVLALAPGRVGGVSVARWDLVELEGAVSTDVPTIAVRITGLDNG